MMRVVVITDEPFFDGEAEAVARLLESGAAWRVHLRKPGCGESDMRKLIEAVPAGLRARLSLHDCQHLAAEYGCGVHLNGRCPEAPAGFNGLYSASCHSLEDVRRRADAAYVFLSPVYDSISKQGYRAGFSPEELCGQVDDRVIALGGVTPGRLSELRRAGFGGAAMLGSVGRDFSKDSLENFIKAICSNS